MIRNRTKKCICYPRAWGTGISLKTNIATYQNNYGGHKLNFSRVPTVHRNKDFPDLL